MKCQASPLNLPLRRLKPRKNLPLRPPKLPHHRAPPLLPPNPNLTLKPLRTMQEPLTISRPRPDIHLHALLLRELKPPQQLRNANKEIALGEMDAGAEAAACAVAVVVALRWV